MLVLSRYVGEDIILGDNVRITVTKCKNGKVTLGIEAPDSVRILRGELEPIEPEPEPEPEPAEPVFPDVFSQTVAVPASPQETNWPLLNS